MEEPIESVMRNESYLKVAKLQDDTVQIIFKTISAVLHGGTAIWRCYGGARFSEDIDLYVRKQGDIRKLVNRITLSDLRITFNRERHGTFYYDISNAETNISLQIKIIKKKSALVFYERVDGTKSEIYSLTPENLIAEKIEAYTDRRLIRDVYDIMVLTKSVSNKDEIVDRLRSFVLKIERPKDEGVLKSLVYNALVPSFASIVEYLQRWCVA